MRFALMLKRMSFLDSVNDVFWDNSNDIPFG
jgi:hypothetical protein